MRIYWASVNAVSTTTGTGQKAGFTFAFKKSLTEADIRRVQEGPDAAGWERFDAALLRATDELHRDAMISDATWKQLAERYDTQQLMDLVFTVGQYNLVSMALNSFGVQRDDGVPGFES